MNFPCAICQYILNGDYLWNIHGSSLNEDRHLLCTPCLIKFSYKNAKCPLRCNNVFNPVQLNPGYKQLVTSANEDFIKNNPTNEANPDKEILENRQQWNEMIHDIDEYIHIDYYPIIYGTGLFENLTYYMRTLKSSDFEENFATIYKLKKESKITDSLSIKVGIKRKLIEEQMRDEIIAQRPRININLSELFDLHRE